MVKRLLVLFCLLPSICFALSGLNLSHLRPESNPEPGILFARSKSLSLIRTNIAISPAVQAGFLKTEHYRNFGALCKREGRIPFPLLSSEVDNLKVFRSELVAPNSPEDNALWASNPYWDWNLEAGVDRRLWSKLAEFYIQIIQAIIEGYGSKDIYVQIENEPGSCKNSKLWPGKPYGWIHYEFQDWIQFIRPKIAALGVKTVAPQFEHESEAGLLMQIFSGRSAETAKFDFESVGFYGSWTGDVESTVKAKNEAWRRIYPVWKPHRPVIFSESGYFSVPMEFRDRLRVAEGKLSWPGVHSRVWFAYDFEGHGLVKPTPIQ